MPDFITKRIIEEIKFLIYMVWEYFDYKKRDYL